MRKASRGRPPFKPTPVHRRKVEEMVAGGMPKTQIARALSVDPDTLQKYFPDELENGLSRKRAEVLALLHKSARTGNVSAQRHLERMTAQELAGAAWGARPAKADDAPAVQPEKLGKKEQAQADAKQAGADSEWGDDLRVGLPN